MPALTKESGLIDVDHVHGYDARHAGRRARCVGTYLLLPHRHGRTPAADRARRGRGRGGPGAAGVPVASGARRARFCPPCSFTSSARPRSPAAVLTVTSRNPIYSALWFASVVLSTSGPVPPGRCPVPGGRHDHRLRRGDHRHLPVRDHAGPDGRQGGLRPRGPGTRAARPSPAYLLFWCLIWSRSRPFIPRPVERANARSRPTARASDEQLLRPHDIIACNRLMTVTDCRRPRPCPDRRPRGFSTRTDRRSPTSPAWANRSTPITWSPSGWPVRLLFVALVGAVAIANPQRPGDAGPDPLGGRQGRLVSRPMFVSIGSDHSPLANRKESHAARLTYSRWMSSEITCWSGPRCSCWACSAS